MRNLNNKIYLGFAVTLAMAMSSCVDDTLKEYTTPKPEKLQQYEYLASYDVLKNYVDRSANPNFKLGVGVSAEDFVKGGLVYAMACSNFDEVTAGNEMKYGSVVKGDNGDMDFGPVKKFVNVAKNAGITIYGHTLAWHAQQNVKYLNSLIAPKVGGGPYWEELVTNGNCEGSATDNFVSKELDNNMVASKFTTDGLGAGNTGKAIVFKTKPKAEGSNGWDSQFFITTNHVFAAGEKIKFSMKLKADRALSFDSQAHTTPGNYKFYTFVGNPSATTEWAEFSSGEVVISAEQDGSSTIAFNLCQTPESATIYFDDISLQIFHEGGGEYWDNLVANSNCESTDGASYKATEMTSGPKDVTFQNGAIAVHAGDAPANSWDSQFFVTVPHTFVAGEEYKFSMKVKADKAASISSQAHLVPGTYKHWAMVGSPSVTTEWQEYTSSGVISAEQEGTTTIAFNLSEFKEANTYYFDDIAWEIKGVGGKPLTATEKKDTLTWALDNWIAGMMKACGGYVTAWDVVNEPLSGGDTDGDGLYDLQSAATVKEADKKADKENNFYWQDYLGSEDYVRIAVKSARKHFAENGGDANSLKLFINDYNLESNWDDNGKLKSLIKWIEKWEADGTKIDGIGTQMHVSYSVVPTEQKSREEHIVKMFQLLASSGKLIKISELDMGISGEDGNAITTDKVTEEQHKAMSEFYNFIVKKYFELIPASQRYGITQWAATDSPSNSGWRASEPIGLWDLNYSRKHTYAGFADGLSNK